MPKRSVRFDPDTVRILDQCLHEAVQKAAVLGAEIGEDLRNRLASALIEAATHGERDVARLVEFAMCVLPAHRNVRA